MKQAQSLLVFPLGGLDETKAYRSQPAYPGGVFTCADALNVRGHEWATDRGRGGSRPGLTKFYQNKTHDLTGLDPFSIQDINQMYLGYIPPDGINSYFVYATGLADDTATAFTEYAGKLAFFDVSCWDHPSKLAFVCERSVEDQNNAVSCWDVRHFPTTALERWSYTWLVTPDVFCGVAWVGRHIYVAGIWTEPDAPSYRIYKLTIDGGFLLPEDEADPWLSEDTYPGLQFSTGAVNVLSGVGDLLGVIVCGAASGGADDDFLIFDTTKPGIFYRTPIATAGTAGAASNRACKVDSDREQYFYASRCVADGKVQKIKADGTVIWSYAPTSDDVVVTYDRPSNRVYVLDRDNGTLKTVNGDTGLLQDTVTTAQLGGLTTWRDVDSDWRGNVILWADNVASGDLLAINARHEIVWGPTTKENTKHTGASVLRTFDTDIYVRKRNLVVSGGRVHTFDRTGSQPVTINPNALDPNVPTVMSWQNGPYMYYADGVGYRRYNPDTDEMEIWTASAGSMPVDPTGRSGRIICTWNGRTCLSGFPADPQNVFMSAKDDPTDWDYAPSIPVPTQAVALSAAYAGLIGDKVTALIPWSDDVLIIGCEHSVWQLTGDPMLGGNIDNICYGIGIAFGEAWCLDPNKVVYFFSTRGGVFTILPGQQPQRISTPVSHRLYSVNIGEDNQVITMGWDDRAQGLHLFVSPLDRRAESTHFFWDKRYAAWWPVRYAHKDFNPKCCHPFRADDVDDRVMLIGSWDSHVRAVDQTPAEDDNLPFDSYVALGPIVAPDGGAVRVDELQAALGLDSAGVRYEIVSANNPEAALAGLAKVDGGPWLGAARSGSLSGGRNPTSGVRVDGYALYIYIRSADVWSIEFVRVRLAHLGWTRGRSF